MVETKNNCPICLKPKSSSSGGFITQFIEVCRCGEIADSPLPPPVASCAQCAKPILAKRSGSLTQWIFRPDLCKCEQPMPLERTGAAKSQPAATAIGEKWDDELTVSPEKFPLSRYAPKTLLGTGGSGTVYLARDRMLRKNVAVKLLHQITGSQLILFQDEARATSRLNHKNIIQILDFGPTETGTPYMVLEYVPNAITLEEQIHQSGALEPDDALEIFVKICDGLKHAHHMGVFHRDLKPSNILIAPEDSGERTVKLIDFGVAKYIDFQDPNQPQATTIAGTPAYMAPEQIRAESYDARSEIYSLGCIFFETLTGKPPFDATTALETMALHANRTAPTLSETLGVECSPMLEEVIAACLEKDKDDRPPSVNELKEALERVGTRPIEAPKDSQQQTASPRKLTKSKTRIAVAALAILSLPALVTVAMIFKTPQPKPKNKPSVAHIIPSEPTTDKIEELLTTDLTVRSSNWNVLRFIDDSNIKRITIVNSKIFGSEQLSPLDRFRRINSINISQCSGLAREEASRLAKVLTSSNGPKSVEVIDCDLDDGGLLELSKIPGLFFLSVEGTRITDAGITTLISAKDLRGLDLTGTAITDGAIENLKKLKRLLILRADNCKISNSLLRTRLPNVSVFHQRLETKGGIEKAIYTEAAAHGNSEGEYQMGNIYHLGNAMPHDPTEALKWYKRAANHGNIEAQTAVGYMYQNGANGPPDLRSAIEWYKKADNNGSDSAPYYLASLYLNGVDGTPVNYKLGLQYLRKSADRGNSDAMQNIGKMYKLGAGVGQDLAQAFQWYHKSALKGNDKALFEVAVFYLDGIGTERNYVEAMKWLRLSAKAGNATAEAHIGFLYENGLGVSRNYDEAIEWYTKSAAHGSSSGLGNLAKMHYEGLGVPKNEEKALGLFVDAAEKGDPMAKNSLGIIYMNGVAGGRPDYGRARTWFMKAVDDKIPAAMYHVGLMNERGLGQQRDLEQAQEWYKRALVAGYTDALPRFNRLEKLKNSSSEKRKNN